MLEPARPRTESASDAGPTRAPLAPIPRIRGPELLYAPLLNKGTAFTDEERTLFGLHGLLPPHVETLDEQVQRAYHAFGRKTDDLERHIYLRALQDTNEVLFYRLLLDHLEEMMPVVYTPVVAQGCQEFSHIYRRPRGLFLPYPLRDSIPQLLQNRPTDRVDVIVVTDGERILGIGDQGAGGLGIPIGKLSLYTLIGGIRPERTLPIVLDVGTNNAERLRDPEYLGWRHPRVRGAEYDAFIDAFVRAVDEELPGVCLQWEDFAVEHARPILERYRDRRLTFNDDIQGTGAVTLAAVQSAVVASGSTLSEQRFVLLGAGSAGIGVADYLRAALVAGGLSDAEARRRFWLVNSRGLLHDARSDLSAEQRAFARPARELAEAGDSPTAPIGLARVVDVARPTVLIGLSTVGGAFSESIVRAMARTVPRPIIFPLSNPTARAEAVPDDLLRWTDGRALVATGSPFAPVARDGGVVPIAQCNNVYIFPALGLGVLASRARRVTDRMLLAAAQALAECAPIQRDPSGPLLPPVAELRAVALRVAVAVGRMAQAEGVAPKTTEGELARRVRAERWTPVYPRYTSD
ncbi:MAG TPA: NAD-dependent malic enzyme [Thermoplasmata archaeon]|nr:NAD-dependent malic enzyme [Thermoplasmata archaeon]